MSEALIICVLIGVSVALLWRRPWQTPTSKPADKDALCAYTPRSSVFVNGAEHAFFNALMLHKPKNAYVFPKVRLEDILQVRSDIKDHKKIWGYRGRIKSRHVDFVLCGQSRQFLCAIELDGLSHKKQNVMMVDDFKDAIFKHAGLPLMRVKVGANFDKKARDIWVGVMVN